MKATGLAAWIIPALLLCPAAHASQGNTQPVVTPQETACEALVKGVATAKAPGVTPPVITRKVEAKYSLAAFKAKAAGVVIVCAVIDAQGRVNRSAVKQSADPTLESPAIEALKRWRFRPAQLNGVPVPIAVELELVFALR